MGGVYGLTAADMGGAVGWIVPTYRNARPVWRFVEQVLAPVADSVRQSRVDMTVQFPSGGWLSVYTGDNDVGIRGEAFDVVIVDEAAMIREETYTDVLLPTLADRDGKITLISTPKGKNWFWREFVKAQRDGNEMAAFTAPSNANPMPSIRRAFEMAKTRVSQRTFQQEWLAQFVDDGGGVFRRIFEMSTAQRQDEAVAGHEYVIGVDWGRTNDATVFSVVDVTAREQCYQDRMLDVDYGLQRSRLVALWERFGEPRIIAEYNSMGGPMVERLQSDGLPVTAFQTTMQSKMQIIDALALAFERGDIHILNDPQLAVELQAYESKQLLTGIRYGAPEGMHDDTVMALALAWSGVVNEPDVSFGWR